METMISSSSQYNDLSDLVKKLNLGDKVKFHTKVDNQTLLKFYTQHG
jgi:hypothetical protein